MTNAIYLLRTHQAKTGHGSQKHRKFEGPANDARSFDSHWGC